MRFLPAICLSLLFGCATPTDFDTGTVRSHERVPSFRHDSEATGAEACYLGEQPDQSFCIPVESLDTDEAEYRYPQNADPQYAAPMAYIDLLKTDKTVQLSQNLQLSEFAASHKGRWAVIQPHLIETLQSIRNELGPLVIESGYRSPQYNRSVGGAAHSRHQYGDAVDIWAMDASLWDVKDACVAHDATYVEIYKGHVHCDWRDMPLDPSFFGETHTHSIEDGGHSHPPLPENEEADGPMETFTF